MVPGRKATAIWVTVASDTEGRLAPLLALLMQDHEKLVIIFLNFSILLMYPMWEDQHQLENMESVEEKDT